METVQTLLQYTLGQKKAETARKANKPKQGKCVDCLPGTLSSYAKC